MNYETIQTTVTSDRIGIIKLFRTTKRNAISIQMREEISRCLMDWMSMDDVAGVIFTGSEGTFSAGFDLNEFSSPEKHEQILRSSSIYHRNVWHFPKPTLAAISGAALGGGFDLAVFCDLRICDDTAIFGHPEVKFGAPPIFSPLKRIVGDGVARDLCLTGRRIDATEAFRNGLVSELTTINALLHRATEIMGTILEAPETTLQFMKNYLLNSGQVFDEWFAVEHDQAFREVLLKRAREGLFKKPY